MYRCEEGHCDCDCLKEMISVCVSVGGTTHSSAYRGQSEIVSVRLCANDAYHPHRLHPIRKQCVFVSLF